MPNFYRDFRRDRAQAIADLERAGFHFIELMKIENGLARRGLNRMQSDGMLCEIADAARQSVDRYFWELETVKR